MTGPGANVSFDGLRDIAQKLHSVGDHLEGPAKNAPNGVKAGPSSAAIDAALSEIMNAAGTIADTAAATSEKVNVNNAKYGEVENVNTDSLAKQRAGLEY